MTNRSDHCEYCGHDDPHGLKGCVYECSDGEKCGCYMGNGNYQDAVGVV